MTEHETARKDQEKKTGKALEPSTLNLRAWCKYSFTHSGEALGALNQALGDQGEVLTQVKARLKVRDWASE